MKTPHGWRSTPLMDLVQQPVSGVSVLSSDELPSASNPGVLRLSCVSNGRFNPRDLKTPIPSEVHRLSAFAEADTIIISRSNTPQLVGASAYVKSTHPNAFLPDTLWSLRPKDKKLSIRWLSFVLNSDAYSLTIQSIAHGTSDSMKKIQKGSFLKLPVLLPPLPEQQKIADILGTWDEALEKLDALIAAKARRKQALMQQLLTGHRRLPGFCKPWEQIRFGDLMKSEDRYADFNDDNLYHLISARRRAEGIFFRAALHGRDIKTKVMKQVRAGDFVISRMQVVHGGLGVVPSECDGFYASDSYEVLVPRDPAKLSPRFIGHLCRTRRFWHHSLVCSHGVHIEKMTFVMADFEHEKFMIPEFAEQIAIAIVLETADTELRLLRQQRAALDHQKRGLMQKLLTGQLRVSTNPK